MVLGTHTPRTHTHIFPLVGEKKNETMCASTQMNTVMVHTCVY
jgi:hypothetical protein